MPEKKYQIKDESGDRKYFAMIPYYIVNHSTAKEHSLYLVMKRLTGENENGVCFASLNELAKRMGVHKTTVSKTIDKLLQRGWIKEIEKLKVKGGYVRQFKIVDLWKKAIDFYDNKESGSEMTTSESGSEMTTSESGSKLDGSGAILDGSGAKTDTKKKQEEEILNNNDNTNVLSLKAKYGNQEINDLISLLKEEFQLKILDGSEKENRKYCWLALNKFKRSGVEAIIKIGARDRFWRTRITGFKDIYYNGVKIASTLKNQQVAKIR